MTPREVDLIAQVMDLKSLLSAEQNATYQELLKLRRKVEGQQALIDYYQLALLRSTAGETISTVNCITHNPTCVCFSDARCAKLSQN